MLNIIKGFIHLVSALLIFVSMKTQLDFWLILIFGGSMLLFGLYSASERKVFTSAIQLLGSLTLSLQLIQQGHPLLSVPIGSLLLLISITTILPTLLE